jgi:hypothetical protein
VTKCSRPYPLLWEVESLTQISRQGVFAITGSLHVSSYLDHNFQIAGLNIWILFLFGVVSIIRCDGLHRIPCSTSSRKTLLMYNVVILKYGLGMPRGNDALR